MPEISGYRVLPKEDIDLINEIKAHANETYQLWEKVRLHVTRSRHIEGTIPDTEAARWAAIARTELQQGYMALTRAVAKPEGF